MELKRRRREDVRLVIGGLGDLTYDSLCAAYCEVGGRLRLVSVPLRVRLGLGILPDDERFHLPVHRVLSVLHQTDGRGRGIYDAELSCVCDQRYGREDMDRIVDAIGRFADK